jgi:protein associated with RNAse G/E
MKRVLSSSGGVTSTFHYSAHDDTAAIQTTSDVTKLLDANKYQRNNQSLHHTSETFNKVASIDTNALMMWIKARGVSYQEFMQDPKWVKVFLNDPDNAAWRTRTGKI